MGTTSRIHQDKASRRRHYIPEWAQHRQLRQVDIVRELGADKGLVSRWFKGVVPGADHLERLAQLLGAEEGMDLFRHPLDDWMTKFLRGRNVEDLERIKSVLETAFPRKVA